MSVSFQLYSLDPARLASLSKAEAVDEFVTEHYCQDVAEVDFEAKWMDKSGMGILEAFGAMDGSLQGPAVWMLGSDTQLPSGLSPATPMLVSQQRTSEVADWIRSVTDAEFAERASNNVIDSEYLAHWFAALRDFYERAASAERSVIVYCSM